jgi:hypothetical protein
LQVDRAGVGCREGRIRGAGATMPIERRRAARFATARQRVGAVLLLGVVLLLVGLARSGRYDRVVDRLAHAMEAGVRHLTGLVHRRPRD